MSADWTDPTDHDPGVALLELFAYLGDLLSGHSDALAAEAYLGSRRRPSSQRRSTCGVHRAAVLDHADPLGRRRLLVRVSGVGTDEGVWAEACLPVHDSGEVPVTGREVWVALESGDPSRPVWLGQRVTE